MVSTGLALLMRSVTLTSVIQVVMGKGENKGPQKHERGCCERGNIQ